MYKSFLIVAISFLGLLVYGQNPVGLQTDYLENPIGLDNNKPRLAWKIDDSRQGAKQLAYRLVVGVDSEIVGSVKGAETATGNGIIWDSGKVSSDVQLVPYGGKDLVPYTKYYWKVIIWDENGNDSGSEVQSFETGMMGTGNWQGNWISDGRDINYKQAPLFRKKFKVDKEIESARVYIAVAGLYELHVNGERIGDHRLDPMYTNFDKRNLYVTYDITDQLQKGDNAVGVILGNGWYNHQSIAVWDFERAPWRNRPTFCLDLKIKYSDGSEQTVYTDLSWRKTDGPVVFNSIYTGEHYDARREIEGWSKPDFDDSKWNGVGLRQAPSKNVTAQQVRPIRNVLPVPAVKVTKFNDSTYLYDFGRNMAGVTKINVQGEEGTVLKIKHGERLGENGLVDLSNIDVYFRGDKELDPFQTDILTLSGREDEFMARFNYKGFRYAEVTSNNPIDLDISSMTAYFMHSDVPARGSIKTSSELINKLWWATNNAYLSNLMGYPTDCPQREKNGWTGDGHFAIETALYNFDGITVYEKWLADHRDEQQPNGVLPDIIPTGGWGYGTANGLDWTSTIAIIPWEIYRFYGDTKLLADTYENIKRYVDYVDRTSPEGLTSWGRGDWVPVKSRSNLELTSSVYFYVDARILANAAMIFGKEDDYNYYSALADKIKNAINKKYLNYETGIYASGTQTELSVPLHWKVVPEDMVAKVAANLAEEVRKTNFHLDVGVLGAKALLNALSDNGYADVAYKVAAQDTFPSWGWWIVNGATTLLENWDVKASRDISDNHMMFGEIGAWFFKGLGGIYPDAAAPGFKHIVLRPYFEKSLKEFRADFNSPYGTIVSDWKWINKNTLSYNVVIPANSYATFFIPDNATIDKFETKGNNIVLEAGTYTFKIKTKGK